MHARYDYRTLFHLSKIEDWHLSYVKQERIQDFKLGGAHLKKLRQIFGVFRVKNPDFTPKNHIFSNFRGGARGCASP
jgi:hypothetical protein